MPVVCLMMVRPDPGKDAGPSHHLKGSEWDMGAASEEKVLSMMRLFILQRKIYDTGTGANDHAPGSQHILIGTVPPSDTRNDWKCKEKKMRVSRSTRERFPFL